MVRVGGIGGDVESRGGFQRVIRMVVGVLQGVSLPEQCLRDLRLRPSMSPM